MWTGRIYSDLSSDGRATERVSFATVTGLARSTDPRRRVVIPGRNRARVWTRYGPTTPGSGTD